MTPFDINKYFNIGSEIIDKAGDYLLKNIGKTHHLSHKTQHHYGIKEDVELNNMYEKYFRKYTSGISLFTEEGERDLTGDLVWVVDPIEGTSNYRVGIPFYATQLCLLYEREPVISFVLAPSLKEKYYAIKNKGSFMNGKRIHVSRSGELDKSMLTINKGTKKEDLTWYGNVVEKLADKVRTFRHFGACGLEMAFTAAGKIDVFICNGSHSVYDYSPGSLIAKEAGAKVTDFEGHVWGIDDSSIIVSNPVLSDKVRQIINA